MSHEHDNPPTPRVEYGVRVGDKVQQHTASGFAFSAFTAQSRADFVNSIYPIDGDPAHVVTRQVTITDWTVYQPAAVAS